jgi:YHS domain-containing protein
MAVFVATVVYFFANSANAAPKAKGNETTKLNVDSKGVILKGYDAVAYFTQGKPVKGNPAIKSNYQGATYLFASAADKAAFDKNPAKYVPQYGGFCAFGVSVGVLSDIEGPGGFVHKGSYTSVEMRLLGKVSGAISGQYRQSGCELAEVNEVPVQTVSVSWSST